MRGDPSAVAATQVSPHIAHRRKGVLHELPQDGIPVCQLVSVRQGMVIVLPIPLGNPLPGIAVAALALGLMHRDGVVLLVGLVCCVFSFIWAVAVIALGAEIATLPFT